MKKIMLTLPIIIIGLTSLMVYANVIRTEAVNKKEVKRILLTWQQDPTKTMTIDWHTSADVEKSTLQYREVGETDWLEAIGNGHGFPFADQIIHRVELINLNPGTDYEFRAQPTDKIYSFRTMPEKADQPIRFVAGGDPGGGEEFINMSKQAALYNPDFIVFSGDWSLENPNPDRVSWFFEQLQTLFMSENNRLIPVIAAIGNHDVWKERNISDDVELDFYRKEYGLKEGDSALFDSLFAFPGVPRYGVLDFGDYLSWIILDSGHRSSIDGGQTEWLESTLKEREGKPHIFASYHVGAYPSHRSYEGADAIKIRDNWVPTFDSYGLDVAFEAHDHMYKRSYLLKGGKVDKNDGVLYLGDGGFGAPTRQPDETPRWYLARSVGDRHAIIGTIHGEERSFIAINVDGKIIDEYPASQPSKVEVEPGKRVVKRILNEIKETVIKSDSLALVKIYKETNGELWKENTNWLTGPVYSWEGVRIKNERVTRLYLQGNNLSGTLSPAFTDLTGLIRLYINGNPELSGELPPEISRLQNLKRIRMHGNSLIGKIPSEISEISGLQQLLLSGNQLSGVIPPEVSKLKYLSELDLSDNRLTGDIPSSLGEMDYRLQRLDLSDNILTGRIPVEFGKLRFLKELHLSNNNFEDDIPKEVVDLQKEELKVFKFKNGLTNN